MDYDRGRGRVGQSAPVLIYGKWPDQPPDEESLRELTTLARKTTSATGKLTVPPGIYSMETSEGDPLRPQYLESPAFLMSGEKEDR